MDAPTLTAATFLLLLSAGCLGEGSSPSEGPIAAAPEATPQEPADAPRSTDTAPDRREDTNGYEHRPIFQAGLRCLAQVTHDNTTIWSCNPVTLGIGCFICPPDVRDTSTFMIGFETPWNVTDVSVMASWDCVRVPEAPCLFDWGLTWPGGHASGNGTTEARHQITDLVEPGPWTFSMTPVHEDVLGLDAVIRIAGLADSR